MNPIANYRENDILQIIKIEKLYDINFNGRQLWWKNNESLVHQFVKWACLDYENKSPSTYYSIKDKISAIDIEELFLAFIGVRSYDIYCQL